MKKYNSVENAERFLREQVEWCLSNGYKNMEVYSNGKELSAMIDDHHIITAMNKGELKNKGYWLCFKMENGKQVSVLP